MEKHLIAMNFLFYNFENIKEELDSVNKLIGKDKNELAWQISNSSKIKVGDIVFIYVSSIPSSTTYYKSRILLKATVKSIGKEKYGNVIRYVKEDNCDDNKEIFYMILKDIKTLKQSDLENDNCFEYNNLKNKYRDFINPQGKRIPNTIDGNLNEGLIDELNKSFDNSRQNMDDLINHFNQECFFKGKIGRPSEHYTFKRRNGTDYFELHHFIQQNSKKRNENLKEVIDKCIVSLCSNCHNKLHYGDPLEINEMIDVFCNDKEKKEILNKHIDSFNVKTIEEVKEFIKETYRVNIDNKNDKI